MIVNKKTKYFLGFIFMVGGATAIYLWFTKNKKVVTPPLKTPKKWTTWISYKVVTSSGNLNVREHPSTTYNVVKQLKNGEIFDGQPIDELNGKWIVVLDTNAKPTKEIGYVSSEFVKENY